MQNSRPQIKKKLTKDSEQTETSVASRMASKMLVQDRGAGSSQRGRRYLETHEAEGMDRETSLESQVKMRVPTILTQSPNIGEIMEMVVPEENMEDGAITYGKSPQERSHLNIAGMNQPQLSDQAPTYIVSALSGVPVPVPNGTFSQLKYSQEEQDHVKIFQSSKKSITSGHYQIDGNKMISMQHAGRTKGENTESSGLGIHTSTMWPPHYIHESSQLNAKNISQMTSPVASVANASRQDGYISPQMLLRSSQSPSKVRVILNSPSTYKQQVEEYRKHQEVADIPKEQYKSQFQVKGSLIKRKDVKTQVKIQASQPAIKKLLSSSSEEQSLAAVKSNQDLANVMKASSRLAVGIHVQHKTGQEGSSTSQFDQFGHAASIGGGPLDSPTFARHEMGPVLGNSENRIVTDPHDQTLKLRRSQKEMSLNKDSEIGIKEEPLENQSSVVIFQEVQQDSSAMDRNEILLHMSRIMGQVKKIQNRIKLIDRLTSRPNTGQEAEANQARDDIKQLEEELKDTSGNFQIQLSKAQQPQVDDNQNALKATLKSILKSAHHHDSKSTININANSNHLSTQFLNQDDDVAAFGQSLMSPQGSGKPLKNGSAVGMNLINKSEVDVNSPDKYVFEGNPLNTYDLTKLNQASEGEIQTVLPDGTAGHLSSSPYVTNQNKSKQNFKNYGCHETSTNLISKREPDSHKKQKEGTTDYFGDALVPAEGGSNSVERESSASPSASRPNYHSVETDSNLVRAEGDDVFDQIPIKPKDQSKGVQLNQKYISELVRHNQQVQRQVQVLVAELQSQIKRASEEANMAEGAVALTTEQLERLSRDTLMQLDQIRNQCNLLQEVLALNKLLIQEQLKGGHPHIRTEGEGYGTNARLQVTGSNFLQDQQIDSSLLAKGNSTLGRSSGRWNNSQGRTSYFGSTGGPFLTVRQYERQRAKKKRKDEIFLDQMTNELRFRSKQDPSSIEQVILTKQLSSKNQYQRQEADPIEQFVVKLETKDENDSDEECTYKPKPDGTLQWGLPPEYRRAAKLGLLKSSQLLTTGESRSLDRELLQDFTLKKLNYSGMNEPVTEAEITAAAQIPTLSGQKDLKQLSMDLLEGMNHRPFVKSDWHHLRHTELLRVQLLTQLDTQKKCLNQRYEKFGAPSNLKNNFNKIMRQMDKAQYHQQNREFMKEVVGLQRESLRNSFSKTQMLKGAGTTSSQFLDPQSVLKRFKKFNLQDINNNRQSVPKDVTPFPTLSAFMDGVGQANKIENFSRRTMMNATEKEKLEFNQQKEQLMSSLSPIVPSQTTRGKLSQSLNFNYGVPQSYLEAKRQYQQNLDLPSIYSQNQNLRYSTIDPVSFQENMDILSSKQSIFNIQQPKSDIQAIRGYETRNIMKKERQKWPEVEIAESPSEEIRTGVFSDVPNALGTPFDPHNESASTNAIVGSIYNKEKQKKQDAKASEPQPLKKGSTLEVVQRFQKPLFDAWDKPKSRRQVVETQKQAIIEKTLAEKEKELEVKRQAENKKAQEAQIRQKYKGLAGSKGLKGVKLKVKGAAQSVILMKMVSQQKTEDNKSPPRTKIGEEMALLRKVEKDPKIIKLSSPNPSPKIINRQASKETTQQSGSKTRAVLASQNSYDDNDEIQSPIPQIPFNIELGLQQQKVDKRNQKIKDGMDRESSNAKEYLQSMHFVTNSPTPTGLAGPHGISNERLKRNRYQPSQNKLASISFDRNLNKIKKGSFAQRLSTKVVNESQESFQRFRKIIKPWGDLKSEKGSSESNLRNDQFYDHNISTQYDRNLLESMSPGHKGSIFNQVIDSKNPQDRLSEQKKASLNLISADSSPIMRPLVQKNKDNGPPTEDSPDHTKFDLMILNNNAGDTSVYITPLQTKEVNLQEQLLLSQSLMNVVEQDVNNDEGPKEYKPVFKPPKLKMAELFQDKSGLEPAEMAIKARMKFDSRRDMSQNVKNQLFQPHPYEYI